MLVENFLDRVLLAISHNHYQFVALVPVQARVIEERKSLAESLLEVALLAGVFELFEGLVEAVLVGLAGLDELVGESRH